MDLYHTTDLLDNNMTFMNRVDVRAASSRGNVLVVHTLLVITIEYKHGDGLLGQEHFKSNANGGNPFVLLDFQERLMSVASTMNWLENMTVSDITIVSVQI